MPEKYLNELRIYLKRLVTFMTKLYIEIQQKIFQSVMSIYKEAPKPSIKYTIYFTCLRKMGIYPDIICQ